ncbi:MAG: hypothetical protein SFW09_15555 [Hyphomicrobiaceae bacterium]|nr:hypothetical protein [Hyphomicrobiaceae bacterium]
MAWRLLAVLVSLVASGLGAAPVRAADKLDLHVENVDDIAFYAVLDQRGRGVAVRICEWSVNPGCAGSVALTTRLEPNRTQMLVVGLCNKVYRGICLRPVGECGKVAGDFTLAVNGWSASRGARLWSQSLNVQDNTYGTKRLWGIRVRTYADGTIRLESRLTPAEQKRIASMRLNEFRNVCPR